MFSGDNTVWVKWVSTGWKHYGISSSTGSKRWPTLINWLCFCVNIYIPQQQMTMSMSAAAFPFRSFQVTRTVDATLVCQQKLNPFRAAANNHHVRCYLTTTTGHYMQEQDGCRQLCSTLDYLFLVQFSCCSGLWMGVGWGGFTVCSWAIWQ